VPLHLVGVHGGQRRVVRLAGADADDPLDRLDENLAVADLTCAGRGEDGLDAGLDERFGAAISIFTFSWNSSTTWVAR